MIADVLCLVFAFSSPESFCFAACTSWLVIAGPQLKKWKNDFFLRVKRVALEAHFKDVLFSGIKFASRAHPLRNVIGPNLILLLFRQSLVLTVGDKSDTIILQNQEGKFNILNITSLRQTIFHLLALNNFFLTDFCATKKIMTFSKGEKWSKKTFSYPGYIDLRSLLYSIPQTHPILQKRISVW